MTLDATIPITPRCHSIFPSTMTKSLSGSNLFLMSSIALVEISRSTFWRSKLKPSRSFAFFSAVKISFANRRLRAARGFSILPAALIRGPRLNPTLNTLTGDLILVIFLRATKPGRVVLLSCSNPNRRSFRFSPTNGTRSATVPIATRSRYCFRSRSRSF